MSEPLSQHLARFDALASDVSSALRADWMRTRAARPLGRAVREMLARTFHTLESIRETHGEALDQVPDAELLRRLYLLEQRLDQARQLLLDANPDAGPAPRAAETSEDAPRRSLRYFEIVNVQVRDAFFVACMRQSHSLGGLADAMHALTESVQRRVDRFLAVLSTEQPTGEEAGGLETSRAWSPRFLPDFWDLELIKRSKPKKKPQ